ncbi:glycosyltransferase family 2 protein [Modestobacter muralis]|uniref:glycosyltransferase n=1 Tax=Modestobacter muralis TaxID=1608614 RepID=UPI001B8D0E3F
MSGWVLAVLVIGVNSVLWGGVGLLRFVDERLARWRRRRRGAVDPPAQRLTTSDVAVLMAAHDEELVIAHSLAAITELVPAGNVHVVSDFSGDATAELARVAGVQVLETATNVGKAGALQQGIDHFGLAGRFGAVLVLDADTQLDPAYFDVALPMFDDPRVAAVAGCAETRWNPAEVGFRGAVVVAHRQRVYTLTQRLLKYGQTWRGVNATHIVPGFASMYRAAVLEQIEVNPSGLVIEDFNMTFELHAKQLGRVAFSTRARAYTQDPSHYGDYVRQTSRWALGLWQTLRRHRPRRGVFALMLTVLIAELLTSSVLFVVLPLVVLLLGAVELAGAVGVDTAAQVADAVDDHVGLVPLLLAVVLPDYLLTCAVALVERRPRYLYLGLFFLAMRVTDAVIALRTLPRAWRTPSNGQWVSPTRRAMVPDGSRVLAPEGFGTTV